MTSQHKRFVGLLLLMTSVILTIYTFYSFTLSVKNRSESREIKKSQNLTSAPAQAVVTESVQDSKTQAPPQDTGLTYHAIELRDLPDNPNRQMITLDGWSFPTPVGPDRFHYETLPYQQAIAGKTVGLLYADTIEPNICIFNIMVDRPGGSFMEGTDVEVAGQLAVENPKPGNCPDIRKPWDVEPIARFKGRTGSGLVIMIPQVRFWRYH